MGGLKCETLFEYIQYAHVFKDESVFSCLLTRLHQLTTNERQPVVTGNCSRVS